jgi:hypothetical protein
MKPAELLAPLLMMTGLHRDCATLHEPVLPRGTVQSESLAQLICAWPVSTTLSEFIGLIGWLNTALLKLSKGVTRNCEEILALVFQDWQQGSVLGWH